VVFDPEYIEWDEANREHATRHGVSVEEITEVLLSNPTIRRNRKGRSGDYFALGTTDGGRKVVVVVAGTRRGGSSGRSRRGSSND
jgi:uncharacterized DUF497 family protein